MKDKIISRIKRLERRFIKYPTGTICYFAGAGALVYGLAESIINRNISVFVPAGLSFLLVGVLSSGRKEREYKNVADFVNVVGFNSKRMRRPRFRRLAQTYAEETGRMPEYEAGMRATNWESNSAVESKI